MNAFACRPATIVSLCISAGIAISASAQEADSLEEIVVTGSYLYTGVDSPSPVSVVEGEDIMLEAPQDLMQYFFTNVPQNFSGDTGAQTGGQGQPRIRGGGRSAQINLRGIGDENTLTVLNGRRTINAVIDGQGLGPGARHQRHGAPHRHRPRRDPAGRRLRAVRLGPGGRRRQLHHQG